MAVANRHRSRRGWMHNVNKRKHTNVFTLSVMIVFRGHTVWLWVHGDNQNKNLLQMTDLLLETTQQLFYCLLKRALVTSVALFLKLRNLKLWSARSAQGGQTKQAERSDRKRLALCFFSVQPPSAADTLSSLRTIEKRCWGSEKNTMVSDLSKFNYARK